MLLLNWNNGNSKSQMSLQSQVWLGHNFLSSSLICQLFTNPILWKKAQFKCKCNLHRGAESRFAVSIANNICKRGNQLKQRSAAVRLRQHRCHSQTNLLLKPPASGPQLYRQKAAGLRIFPDSSSCTYYCGVEERRRKSFQEPSPLILLKSFTDYFLFKINGIFCIFWG